MRRYLPAESVAVLAALAGAALAFRLTANWEVVALASNWAETASFYLVMATREFIALDGDHGRLAALPLVIRNLSMEFALAEAIDSFVIRPIFMDGAMHLTGDVAVGVVIGKFLADITFYVPTIISYELRRNYLDATEPHQRRHRSGLAIPASVD
jgi:hypothetical protein